MSNYPEKVLCPYCGCDIIVNDPDTLRLMETRFWRIKKTRTRILICPNCGHKMEEVCCVIVIDLFRPLARLIKRMRWDNISTFPEKQGSKIFEVEEAP